MVAMIAYETWGSSLGITICAKTTNMNTYRHIRSSR
jgi:hypothetical protein